ncbi:GNAT family N-acetyltransferase [Alicyclobacillus pomorum]|uniref:GNAT family N-acetyltransferase n=1 Tax=Alicyclobacillus pomorum TaxID=204470 RepID=UPI00041A596B|nr:GNAT family N-acetyltransferase [Alicyclobacillus pomorum]
MEATEIRQARTWAERESCLMFWSSVFPEDASYFAERLAAEADCGLETTWLALVDGQMVSAAQVFPYWARLGKASVRMGGIGNVATRPDYRGRGLARAILNAQIHWMSENGFAVSALYTGIPDFYEALGWRIAPREMLVVEGPALATLAAEPSAPYEVNPYRASDAEEVCRLYEAFNAGRPGSRIRELPYAQASFDRTVRRGTFLLARRNGRLAGYVRAVPGPEKTVRVCELCYAEGEESAAPCLVQQLARRSEGLERLEIGVPADHHLWAWVSRGMAAVKPMNDVMCRIVDPVRLMAAWRESGFGDTVTDSSDDTAALAALLLAGARPSHGCAAGGALRMAELRAISACPPMLWESDAY